MNPFEPQQKVQPSWWQKLLSLTPKENALIELNNRLAQQEILHVTFDDLQAVEEKYNVNLHKRFESALKSFYRKFLEASLNDRQLSEQEVQRLQHLKKLFRFNDQEVAIIHNEVAGRIYGERLAEALEDEHLSDEERDFLNQLQQHLQLPDDVIEDIYREQAGVIYQRLMERSVSDERLSPEEEEMLTQISDNLGLEIKMDQKTQEKLDRFRLYWQIENGELPRQDVRINLYKNEECYFHTLIDWYEHRRQTKRLNYSGPTLRVKIAKGLYWRAGSLGGHTVSEDTWKHIDSGELYLTNKRILFIGSRGNKRIYLKRILDFDAYENGVQIQKDAGKSPFFAFEENVDIFALILGRLLFRE